MRSWVWAVLLAVFGLLQYKLWMGQGGLLEQSELRRQIQAQAQIIQTLRQENEVLQSEVIALSSDAGLEEAARLNLGAKRPDETYIRVAP
ncbi:MAG: FtsB family cell division protein [Litorivicinus sp.]